MCCYFPLSLLLSNPLSPSSSPAPSSVVGKMFLFHLIFSFVSTTFYCTSFFSFPLNFRFFSSTGFSDDDFDNFDIVWYFYEHCDNIQTSLHQKKEKVNALDGESWCSSIASAYAAKGIWMVLLGFAAIRLLHQVLLFLQARLCRLYYQVGYTSEGLQQLSYVFLFLQLLGVSVAIQFI